MIMQDSIWNRYLLQQGKAAFGQECNFVLETILWKSKCFNNWNKQFANGKDSTWILAPRYTMTPGMQVKVVNSYEATWNWCKERTSETWAEICDVPIRIIRRESGYLTAVLSFRKHEQHWFHLTLEAFFYP